MNTKEKIKDAILSTLVVKNIESFEKYTWPKIEKVIKDEKDINSRSSTSSKGAETSL